MTNNQQPKPPARLHPWLVVALNAWPLPLGLGYFYARRPSRGLAVIIVQFFSLLALRPLGLANYNPYLLAALWLFSLWDGYRCANDYNLNLLAQSTPAPAAPAQPTGKLWLVPALAFLLVLLIFIIYAVVNWPAIQAELFP